MLNTVIVIPCYNEAGRLNTGRFRDFLAQHPHLGFVLVNDGSQDGTVAVLEQLRAGFEDRVAILDRKENRGKGESVREGLLCAIRFQPEAQRIGFWDADLATPLEAIANLEQILETHPGIEMVFGARVNLLGRHIERQAIRHYLGRIFATTVSVLLKLPVYDTQCGAKLFRVSPELVQVLEQGPFITRWVFDVELMARWIQSHDFKISYVRSSIYEFPLYAWEDVAGSKVKPYDFFKAFRDVIRIYLRYLRH